MLRGAWLIARKDLAYLMRQRETLLWTFVMPLVFFYFIGTITAGFGGGGSSGRPSIAVEGPAGGFLAARLEGALREEGFEPRRADAGPSSGARRLVLPPEFSTRLARGETVAIDYIDSTEDPLQAQASRMRVTRAAYRLLAETALAALEADGPPTQADLDRIDGIEPAVVVEVSTAGRRIEPPSGFAQAVPGTMVMFTLLVLLTSGAVLLVQEREAGLLRRLASAPMSRASIVAGKWLGKLMLGMVQLGFALVVGRWLFGVSWGPHPLALGLVLLAWATLAAGLGLLLGSLARSIGQAVAFGVLASNLLAALGGCWWPIEVAPGWMQQLARFLPTGWAMQAIHRLVSFADAPVSVLPQLGALAAASVVVAVVATRRFRFQ